MLNKKALLFGALVSTVPCTTQSFFNTNILFNLPIEIPINKKTLLIGGAIAGGVLAATLIYRYFWILTLPKAQELCHEITEYVDYVATHYEREFTLLEKNSDRDTQKAELQNIITELDSESPYLAYTNQLRKNLSKAENYEKRFARGIPQLEKAMDKLIKKSESVSGERFEKLQRETNYYKAILQTIAQLREILHALRHKLTRIANYCVQYDAYKQEKILEQLQAIQTQLILNHLNQTPHYHYHAP